MTNAISEANILQELVVFIRNSDILTITERGVSTESDSDTLSGANSYTVIDTGIRNIRSVTMDASPLTFGTEYTVVYGSANAVISFVSAQTGDLIVSYDKGTSDRIYDDFPRPDLKLSSYPRLAVDLIDIASEPGGMGNVNRSFIDFTMVAYAETKKKVRSLIDTTREKFIAAQTSFFYMKVVKPLRQGPMLPKAQQGMSNKILQKNSDYRSLLNYEKNN